MDRTSPTADVIQHVMPDDNSTPQLLQIAIRRDTLADVGAPIKTNVPNWAQRYERSKSSSGTKAQSRQKQPSVHGLHEGLNISDVRTLQ